MKKVGIMSMQRIANYGSFLQAYGLKKTIEELGHEVQFVDYEYENAINKDKFDLRKKIKKLLHLKKNLKIRKEWKIFQKKYFEYINKYLNIAEEKNIRPNDIDKLVIGSDEVFNCMQGYPVGYSRELFGKNYSNIDVISYAASFGFTNLELINKYNLNDELHNLLTQFKSISVRDKNSYDVIKKLTNIDAYMNLDPVLISNFDYPTNVKLKNYIIVYTYPGRLSSKEEKYIKKFAKKHNKKIVSLGFYQNIADINLYVEPLEVFSYFKNADFVITDTFHGTIFSIKMNTKFCTIIRKSNENKLKDLLSKLNLSNRTVYKLEDIEKKYYDIIDFGTTNSIIKEERKKAINYLERQL